MPFLLRREGWGERPHPAFMPAPSRPDGHHAGREHGRRFPQVRRNRRVLLLVKLRRQGGDGIEMRVLTGGEIRLDPPGLIITGEEVYGPGARP